MKWRADQALAWLICHEPRAWRDWTPAMVASCEQAKKDLAEALAHERVQAWGRRTRDGSLETVPSDRFDIPGLPIVVGPDGQLSPLLPHKPYFGEQWQDIKFDADEIKRAWPLPPTPSALDWMVGDAEARLGASGQPGKRDDMIQRCMVETQCTKRQAEAAYKELPEKLRRKQGKPPKHRG